MGGLQSVIYWLDRSTIPVDFVVFDTTLQATIDSLKKEATKPTIYPFNPNYLTDYRAYFLELTPQAIDRLLAFRQNGNWIHSAQEFQHITQVDAQWMEKYAPYFKFPKAKKNYVLPSTPTPKSATLELNKTTSLELKNIYGIGAILSQRIIKYRNYLGGFSTPDQLDEVYGLSDDVLIRLKERVKIKTPPTIHKIDMNKATLNELIQLPYINSEDGRKIIALRSSLGKIDFAKLYQIKQFDSLKIKRLALYLF